ncbi:hypothetical protein D0962_03450 [Leptolyngbyaceae cyanobacterium CCMR0082]|uniref:Uncharacterized protein n=1 Tax=Adonisia turfae CCMR0082 TaxID=2304604 RepID=A0A6M0S057_9CYAN|nr:hypothetical protein [Adonisia turfae]NEZ61837.1 hypothetical protein [Adonisia turfae CCMR0082]
MLPKLELRHLQKGPSESDLPEGIGLILFDVHCPNNANDVLHRAQTALSIVLQQQGKNWPKESEWFQLMPNWFIEQCADERNEEEERIVEEEWRGLSSEEQMLKEKEEAWTLMEWISWFEPSEEPSETRYWFWWDGLVRDPSLLSVAVEVTDIPFPWGSLDWLLRASGAIEVEISKD